MSDQRRVLLGYSHAANIGIIDVTTFLNSNNMGTKGYHYADIGFRCVAHKDSGVRICKGGSWSFIMTGIHPVRLLSKGHLLNNFGFRCIARII